MKCKHRTGVIFMKRKSAGNRPVGLRETSVGLDKVSRERRFPRDQPTCNVRQKRKSLAPYIDAGIVYLTTMRCPNPPVGQVPSFLRSFHF